MIIMSINKTKEMYRYLRNYEHLEIWMDKSGIYQYDSCIYTVEPGEKNWDYVFLPPNH